MALHLLSQMCTTAVSEVVTTEVELTRSSEQEGKGECKSEMSSSIHELFSFMLGI